MLFTNVVMDRITWACGPRVWCYVRNTEDWIIALFLLIPQKGVIFVTLPWQRRATRKCEHHWRVHRNFTESVAAPTPHSWPSTNRFSLLWSFEREPPWTFGGWWGIGKRCASVAAEEGEQRAVGIRTCSCTNMEDDCWQRWRIY